MSDREHTVIVSSEYAYKPGSGLVALRMDEHEVKMLPERARLLATELLVAAERAETEATLFDFFRHRLSMGDAAARAALAEYRLHRTKLNA